jgi:hypothetical protein
VDWINFSQVRDQWRALVNTGMNHRVLQKDGESTGNSASPGLSRPLTLSEAEIVASDMMIHD